MNIYKWRRYLKIIDKKNFSYNSLLYYVDIDDDLSPKEKECLKKILRNMFEGLYVR